MKLFHYKRFEVVFVNLPLLIAKKSVLSILVLLMTLSLGYAQQKVLYGNVYAFKDLPLNNIKISASSTKNIVYTDSLGKFRIICDARDKLEFTGDGFKKVLRKLEAREKSIKVKMIFKGGDKNTRLAIDNNHVSKDALESSIKLHPDLNYEYYNYPDIYSAIDRIYASNTNIRVQGKLIFVRKEKSQGSAYPAIYIVNGKLALDIIDIQTRDIESIEIIPDGSSEYGPGAANGVVLIKTLQ